MSERPRVALLRCSNYDAQQVEDALRRLVDLLGGLERYVQPGQRVLLKPNLLRAMPPEAAVATHPSVVRAVVRLVQEAGATAVIADSPGGPFTPLLLRRLYERTGMRRVAEETGAELNYDTATVCLPYPKGGLLKRIDVMAAVAGADVVINLPKFKTHNLTRLSLAVKNLFGVVPGVTKVGYHAKLQDVRLFAQGLVDIARCVRPALTIVDGVVAMDGDGPSGGDPFAGQILLAGTDVLAVDVVAMSLVGWDPPTMPTIRVAMEQGLTGGRLEDIDLYGDPPEALRLVGFRPGSAATVDPGLVPRRLLPRLKSRLRLRSVHGQSSPEALDVGTVPSALRGWVTRQLVVTPRAGERCTGCGQCVDLCPVGAIRVSGGKAQMDARRCIRCYCCHELCPSLAVELGRPPLGRLLFGA